MKYNSPNSCKNLICIKKFIFSDLSIMRVFLVLLCFMMIIPAAAYAQSNEDTLQIEHEEYILKRTGETIVKIFGNIELDRYNVAKLTLTHTNPESESINHNIIMNDEGYYEFYFVHDWKSTRGNYDISVNKNDSLLGTISYELIQDPSYKTAEEVKEEYYLEKENRKINAADLTKKIPDWVKNIFGWYYLDRISEDEVINAIQYLIRVDIIKID